MIFLKKLKMDSLKTLILYVIPISMCARHSYANHNSPAYNLLMTVINVYFSTVVTSSGELQQTQNIFKCGDKGLYMLITTTCLRQSHKMVVYQQEKDSVYILLIP